ncbi:MAG: hypothetical protein OZ948_07410 [Deltaproteobacteria bacterium]|nr:hypothetical protein [Deltaproteobacteria bacterium]
MHKVPESAEPVIQEAARRPAPVGDAATQAAAAGLAGLTALALLLAGCTTTDPYTGEQRIDATNTALAVGALAAVGAVAYAATRDDDDEDDDDDWDDRWDRYYRPSQGVRCYRAQRACFDRDGYSAYWTRREFGRSRR